MHDSERLFTRPFLALNAVMFLTFCNMAVFFQFSDHLKTLAIDRDRIGFLIGVFSLTVLVIRPIISPFLRPDNSRRWIAASAAVVMISLFLYRFGDTFPLMAAVRIIHGIGYVVLATSVLSALVACIPTARSAQAFGMISVLTLLPYAVIPPLLKPLTDVLGGFDAVLQAFGIVMVLVFPIVYFADPTKPSESPVHKPKITFDEFVVNLKDHRILFLMLASLLVWASFTAVFYYLKGYGEKIGVVNPGWFFTLSTCTEIGVRLFTGQWLDRMNKPKLLLGALLWLLVCYIVMARLETPALFNPMGLLFGLGWGVTMPLLSSLVFDISPPKLRALNTNLSMEMFQGGFFVGPLAGGAIMLHGGHEALFLGGAVGILFAALLAVALTVSIAASARR